MLIFRPNQGSSTKYVNVTLNIAVATTAQATSALDVITYGQAIDTAKLYANKANETFNTPITVTNPVNNTDTVTRKFLFDTIFSVTKAYVTPILDQYANKNGGTFTGPISRDSDPYNLNNAPSNDNTAITNKFANDKLNQAASAASGTNAVVTGQIYEIYGSSTPDGYLKCNGAAVSKSTYSGLYGAIGDYFTLLLPIKESGGIPWQSQCGFNSSTQNDITNWSSTNSLTTALYVSVSLVTKNYIYMLGGRNSNGEFLDTIQRASFDSDGNLSSTWSNVGTLPATMKGMGYVATKGRFYLIGGVINGDHSSSVYSAPINADGTLGDFRTEISLPAKQAHTACFVIKNKLYAVGGENGTNYLDTVYQTTINNDGSLSNWKTLSNFPIIFSFGRPLLIKNRIYIFGTINNNNSETYYATYDSNGNIGSWTSISNMPNNIWTPAIVSTDNYVFSIGGYDQNNSKYTNAAYRAPISSDGSIGDWVQISDGPITAGHAQIAIAGNKTYFIGGKNDNGILNSVYSTTFTSGITDYTPYYTDQQNTPSSAESAGIPWKSQYGFNPSTQNDITGWVSANSLVTATTEATSLVTKNYIYVLGGYNSNGVLNNIQRVSFDANGDLTSSWSNVGTLPVAMHGMGYVATKGRFYLIGGETNSGYSSAVYSAPINSDGTLGDFRTETSLPDARFTPTCFVIKNKLYLVSGSNNNNNSDYKAVYKSTINNDGTLSSWNALPDFPIGFQFGKPLFIKDRIYIFGTYDANGNSKIYYSTYDSDGNIGSWTYVSDMPNNIYSSAIVCTDNYVFSIGGYDQANSTYTNAAYRASILSDGSIGSWTQISDGSVAASYAQSAIAGNRIYFIGGHYLSVNNNNATILDTVYSASFTSGITDYTPYYTDQSNMPSTFNLPDLPSTSYSAYYIKA
jgi:N-acetylneuraminic acid mutarotase